MFGKVVMLTIVGPAACGRSGFEVGQGARGDVAVNGDSGTASDAFEGRVDIQPYGVCNEPGDLCREWIGAWFTTANLSVSCDFLGGSFSMQECANSALAVCILNGNHDPRRVDFFYYSSAWDLGTASADCESKDLASSGLGSTTSSFHLRVE